MSMRVCRSLHITEVVGCKGGLWLLDSWLGIFLFSFLPFLCLSFLKV